MSIVSPPVVAPVATAVDVATRETTTRRFVLWVCLGMLALRSTTILQSLRSDEAGYLMTARQWHLSGANLYGDYFVDRPPLLMAIFKLAASFEWDPAIRVIALPFAVLFVVAAAWSAHVLAGPSAARWSALVSGALISTPAVAADQADGELFAVSFVMASVGLTLAAWFSPSTTRRFWLAVGAGCLAVAAALVKQSFLDGLVFAIALLVAAAFQQRLSRRHALTLVSGGLVGGVVPLACLVWWLDVTGLGAERWWTDVIGLRMSALEVLWGTSPRLTVLRALLLVALALLSGILPVVAGYVMGCRNGRLRGSPVTWAVGATLLFGVVAVTLGGSYWPHYLLQLAPVISLAAGWFAADSSREGLWMRGCSLVAVGSATVGCLSVALVYLVVPQVWAPQRTGEWLADSSASGDTAFIAYGHASTLYYAGLESPYQHLWSAPMRVRDPNLTELTGVVRGPDAPTWIVEWNGFNSWQIDADSSLRNAVAARYRPVESVCGNRMWLLRSVSRDLAPTPDC